MICSEYLAGRFSGDDSPELAAHRAVCAACSASDAELALVRGLLTDPDTWAEPDPGLEDRGHGGGDRRRGARRDSPCTGIG